MRLTHILQTAIRRAKNGTFNHYIRELSANDHSIWKATTECKRPIFPRQKSARSTSEKSIIFAEHLAGVFTSNSDTHNDDDVAAY
jgi:hypothetical protein